MIIRGGYVLAGGKAEKKDILISEGKILKIADAIDTEDGEVYDASGKYVFPGLIDMHTHLREPGFEYKEDLKSGGLAAVAGGFTHICCMPNTRPVCDNAAIAGYIKRKADDLGTVKISPIGAATVGENGESLSEYGKMKEEGIVAVSDDGKPIENAVMLRNVLEYASDFNLPVLCHCEEKTLSENGCVNEGYYSTLTGLKRIHKLGAELDVARTVLMAEGLKKPVHICHVSTAGSVRIIREAKKRGVAVTAETCPHYIVATDEIIQDFDTDKKFNPPIRELIDQKALINGLIDGTIDVIATDHAPHHEDDKRVEYQKAAFGISGLETAFSLSYTKLCLECGMPLEEFAKLLTEKPAKILGIEGGVLREGAAADIMIADLNEQYIIDSSKFLSIGKNTPFVGWKVYGKVLCTIVDGEVKYKRQ